MPGVERSSHPQQRAIARPMHRGNPFPRRGGNLPPAKKAPSDEGAMIGAAIKRNDKSEFETQKDEDWAASHRDLHGFE